MNAARQHSDASQVGVWGSNKQSKIEQKERQTPSTLVCCSSRTTLRGRGYSPTAKKNEKTKTAKNNKPKMSGQQKKPAPSAARRAKHGHNGL
jgi:single-stranded DNA-binding protein